MTKKDTEPEKCMDVEPRQAWEERERVCLDFPVCFEQVYQTVMPSSLLVDHMTAPHNPPEQETVLQQVEDKHPEPDLPVRGMAEPACSQRTSDRVDRREGHRVMASVPYKDTVVRMLLAVGTDRRLVLVLAVR